MSADDQPHNERKMTPETQRKFAVWVAIAVGLVADEPACQRGSQYLGSAAARRGRSSSRNNSILADDPIFLGLLRYWHRLEISSPQRPHHRNPRHTALLNCRHRHCAATCQCATRLPSSEVR